MTMHSDSSSKAQDASNTSSTSQRYHVYGSLGQGGMAEILHAYDNVLQKDVALKRLRALEDQQYAARRRALFEREYYTLSEMAHPRIIEVYDYGVDEKGPYYTMELLDGGDLREMAPLSWKVACQTLRDAASSLALLHSRRLIHRDVTPRNIRCTSEGRAKLIDFGALAAMGASNEIIGTPPFVPPEAFHGDPLDARADLYALGATAFFVLTRQHAYPARTVAQLPRFWRDEITPLHRLVSDIPESLETLIMSLLSLDPQQRPRNAMEVIEQLSAIGELPDDETLHIQQAFLSTPPLVGRARVLERARRLVQKAQHGEGGALSVKGEAGTGRSRLLAACALEARLAGLTVLRADATHATGTYGVALRLVEELCSAVPSAEEHLQTLVPHWDRLRGRTHVSEPPGEGEDDAGVRKRRLGGLRQWFVEVSQQQPLMLAIDDFDAIDEPSAALLALLADESPANPLAVAVSLRAEHEPSPQVEVLRRASRVVTLAPLNRPQVAELLAYVFGRDTPNLAAVTDRVFEESQGNPAACVLLAEHLVEQNVVTYDRGGWRLPATIEDEALPAGLEAALLARFDRLSKNARHLAEAIALSDGVLPLEEYGRFVDEKDVARALDELVTHQVLRASEDRYVLVQSATSRVLRRAMDEPTRRRLHSQLADALEAGGMHPVTIAEHLLHAGREEESAERAYAFAATLTQEGTRFDSHWMVRGHEVFEQALETGRRLGKPPLFAAQLRQALLASTLIGNFEAAFRHGPALEAQLREDLGLIYWDELDPSAEDLERLQHGMSRAQQVYDRTPEAQRGFDPSTALYALGRFVMYNLTPASVSLNIGLLQRLQGLIHPFVSISPVFELIAQHVQAALDAARGFLGRCREGYRRALELVEKSRDAGLPEYRQIRLGTVHALAQMSYTSCAVDPAWLEELANDPLHEANAWRLREYEAVLACDLEAADAHAHRAERAVLQNTGHQAVQGGTVAVAVMTAARLDSIARLRRVEGEAAPLAERYASYGPYLGLVRGVRRYLCGDYEQACHELSRAHEGAPIGGHGQAHLIFAWYVRALAAAGESAEAVRVAREAWKRAEECDFWNINPDHPSRLDLMLGTALGQAAGGDGERALQLWERAVAEAEAMELPLLMRTGYWEYAALVALHALDETRFERCVAALEGVHAACGQPLVSRRLKAVKAAGSRVWSRGDAEPETLPQDPQILGTLRACASTSERDALALRFLVHATASTHGFLFVLGRDGLELRASSPGFSPPEALLSQMSDLLDAFGEPDSVATRPATEDETSDEGSWKARIPCDDCAYQVVFLQKSPDEMRELTALVALDMPGGEVSVPSNIVAGMAQILAE